MLTRAPAPFHTKITTRFDPARASCCRVCDCALPPCRIPVQSHTRDLHSFRAGPSSSSRLLSSPSRRRVVTSVHCIVSSPHLHPLSYSLYFYSLCDHCVSFFSAAPSVHVRHLRRASIFLFFTAAAALPPPPSPLFSLSRRVRKWLLSGRWIVAYLPYTPSPDLPHGPTSSSGNFFSESCPIPTYGFQPLSAPVPERGLGWQSRHRQSDRDEYCLQDCHCSGVCAPEQHQGGKRRPVKVGTASKGSSVLISDPFPLLRAHH